MKQKIQSRFIALASITAVILLVSGCTLLGIGTGTVNLSLTDAPVDASNVDGVYITVTGLEYNKSALTGDPGWTSFPDFVPMEEPVNLLALTGGVTELLGSFELTAGQYNQIRLTLEMAEENCYIAFSDETTAPLSLPSNGAIDTEFKLVNAFTVPYGQTVNMIIDFDVRKGIVMNGTDYKLKPALRLIVEDQAGKIVATVDNTSDYSDLAVFAYDTGTYTESEDDDPVIVEGSRFPNAVTSAVISSDGKYVLPYLAAGTYDLVVAGYNADEFGEVLGRLDDVTVENEKVETVTITLP